MALPPVFFFSSLSTSIPYLLPVGAKPSEFIHLFCRELEELMRLVVVEFNTCFGTGSGPEVSTDARDLSILHFIIRLGSNRE